LLTGCASYQAHPLPEKSMLADNLHDLQYSVKKQQEAGLQHAVNPADGLDLTEVAIIAVLNNPDLQAERTKQKVAGAQLFAAGLLPDPQISANLDIPTGTTNGAVNAWGLGLGYEIIPLITRQARIDAEQQAQVQVNLHLLWQEWQVMQQARSLAISSTLELKKLELLRKTRDIYQHRYDNSSRALKAGDITLDVNGTDLTALLDASSQVNQLEQAHNKTRHQINLLLGLAPAVDLRFTLPKKPVLLTRKFAENNLEILPERRPDLLALQAGYQSQEAKVRTAVLSQFPSLSIGITRAKDSGSLYTTGFGISLNLPLFTGSRGAIAIERATREQLKLEYQARLSRARTDVDRLLELQGIIAEQQARLKKYLPQLRTIVEKTRQAYANSDIDALTFFNMEYTWILKRVEEIDLEQAQWENNLALQVMLALPEGNGLPSVKSSGN
ncbi:MAG TPA: TolC family protein, partial [Desulfobulbaceae bacterium]|nr:TolC family protein [Desulfobulbaceae bacterium]